MSQDLVQFERQLDQIREPLAEILPPGVPAARITRTVWFAASRLPKLLQCNRRSLINSAWSCAVLGLEADGVTGQAYLIPYNHAKAGLIAQLQIGFKGYQTIAARGGFILKGGVIREGDVYDIKGAGGVVHHVSALGQRTSARIEGAYCNALSNDFPDIGEIMDIDEIEAIRRVAKTGNVWRDWYDQMAIKTVKKRLAKTIPMIDIHRAMALDDAATMGREAHMSPDKMVVVEGEERDVYPERSSPITDEQLPLGGGGSGDDA